MGSLGVRESRSTLITVGDLLVLWFRMPLTIEERLERLTERHEALTQTVELMAEENKQRDRRLGEIMEGIARLLHVAEIHEQRISRLEGD